ncbi:GWT [Parasponia andersonii]|uniref:GWT n=1 Tax=Parasponia andersonii TaxID=3476 RepID=A0A2P5BGV5_PARAD|nr:GWT [Parasponia andersonii]
MKRFVSNLSGSSMLEIAALSTLVPLLILLRHSFASDQIIETNFKKNGDAVVRCKTLGDYMATLVLDFLLIVLPILLFLTVLADWVYQGVILMMLFLLFVVASKSYTCCNAPFSPSANGGPLSLRTNISSYRVSMMIVTCLCILAVDFRIFPRRYAKTETYGTGLMDIGVGSFVLANSLVSRQARNILSLKFHTAVQSTSPLLILGFARLLSTVGVNYQVHVGEYGVHWNFFFTLAAISILTSIINVPPQYCGILGLVILVGYQGCLMQGLNLYLLSNERGTDLVSQNKEGLFSIFGYWGIYLIGVQLGNFLFFQNQASRMRSKKWARIGVWMLSLLFWLLTMLIDRHFERVSRRMCNLAYTTMVLAVNLQVLGILMLSDFIPGSKTSVLEHACSRSLLATFLLANVLTGLVNLSMNTLYAPPITALSILIAYAFILSVVIGLLDLCGIRLKFW